MPRSSIRIVFSVLLSLVLIAVVYTSVLGAPLGVSRVGSHLVSGARVNLDHHCLAVVDQSDFGALDSLSTHQDGVHGCGGDHQPGSPDD